MRYPKASAFMLGLCSAGAASAQAVEGNADDAFGLRVGVESIGLYASGEVRGFNLQNAGNFRIEGNYFARAASPQYLVRGATTNRVGINALRYDFPAPSGVVDIDLRPARDGANASVEAGTRAYSGPFSDITASYKTPDGKWSVAGGVNLGPWQRYTNDASGDYYGGGVVGRFAPTKGSELTAFATLSTWVADPDTGYLTDGTFIPPKIKRGVFRMPKWTKFNNREQMVGLFGKTEVAGWALSGGAFHSAFQAGRTDFTLVSFDNEEGDYTSVAAIAPRRSGKADSASMLASRTWGDDRLRHRVVFTARHRKSTNVNSPSFLLDAGSGNIFDGYRQVEEPDYTISDDRIRDVVRQSTGGAGYRVTIGNKVELRGDVQRTFYEKDRTDIAGVTTRGKSDPWLYSGSASWLATDALTLFASYSKGLEESGVAPSGASNRGDVLPAVIASQRELGARYALTPKLSLIAGVFDTRKDTPGIAPDGRFALIGNVRHRGIEASLAGDITPRLNIVAGFMALDARLSGELVDAGLIGKHPAGLSDRLGQLSLGWNPKFADGLSLDATLNYEGGRYVDSSNTLRSDPLTTVDIGMRYPFKIGQQRLSLRARVVNLFDAYEWQPDASGTFFFSAQRGYSLSLRADF